MEQPNEEDDERGGVVDGQGPKGDEECRDERHMIDDEGHGLQSLSKKKIRKPS